MSAPPAWRSRSKYRNVRSEYGGRTFDSKAQAQYAAELDLRQRAGEIRAWIPEVSLPLPTSSYRMRIDFMLIMADGSYRWQDVKGAPPTRDWKLKQDLVRNAYGIDVEVVQRRARRT